MEDLRDGLLGESSCLVSIPWRNRIVGEKRLLTGGGHGHTRRSGVVGFGTDFPMENMCCLNIYA